MRFDAVRCGAVRCGAVRCDAMRCDAMRCDAMLQCNLCCLISAGRFALDDEPVSRCRNDEIESENAALCLRQSQLRQMSKIVVHLHLLHCAANVTPARIVIGKSGRWKYLMSDLISVSPCRPNRCRSA